MTVPQPQSLQKKENQPKSSRAHIPTFWSLLYIYIYIHICIHIYIYIIYIYVEQIIPFVVKLSVDAMGPTIEQLRALLPSQGPPEELPSSLCPNGFPMFMTPTVDMYHHTILYDMILCYIIYILHDLEYAINRKCRRLIYST